MTELLVKGQLKSSQRKHHYICSEHGKRTFNETMWWIAYDCKKCKLTHKTIGAGYNTYTVTLCDDFHGGYNINTPMNGIDGFYNMLFAECDCPQYEFGSRPLGNRAKCKHIERVKDNVLAIMAIVGIGRTNPVASFVLMGWMKDREQGPMITKPKPHKMIKFEFCNHLMPHGNRCEKESKKKYGNRCSVHRNIGEMFDACQLLIS